jgi:hypothetical protein
VVIYIKYENDLQNGTYKPDHDRIALLKSPLFKIRDEFKLLSYASAIGFLDPIKNFAISIIKKEKKDEISKDSTPEQSKKDLEYLENFKHLVATYGFDKKKFSFLLNSRTTSSLFLNYCNQNGYQIIDFSSSFENSKKPTTLIYDMHWNNHGRELIAALITNYFKKEGL